MTGKGSIVYENDSPFYEDYKKESILAPLFKMLEATLELLVPLVVASIIDEGIYHGSRRHIFLMCLVLFGLALIGLLFSITAQYFAAKSAVARRQPCAPGCFGTFYRSDIRRWTRREVRRSSPG